jgi:hypothetical protein
MKKFINEILKPMAIFIVYYIIIASLSSLIEQIWHIEEIYSIMVLIIVTYPIYNYFIDK